MIIRSKFIFLFQLLITVKLLLCLKHAFGVGDEKVLCAERDSEALLSLKHELTDGFGRLSSWGTENNMKDCCRWKGVGCDNKTGNVIGLDLHGPQGMSTYSSAAPLRGEIGPSLFELKHLKYLDLSYNEFSGNILSNISSLGRLEYLNLSRSGFYSGTVPPDLGNLSNLHTLDLSLNSFLRIENLDWLSHLRLLECLQIGGLNVSKATNWAQEVSRLPLLRELRMPDTMLPDVNPFLIQLTNFSSMSLAVLDLSSNKLNSSVYDWLLRYNRTLSDINLSDNHLQGPIPDAFGSMVSLEHLDVSQNKLKGGLPESFRNLSALKSLKLSVNSLSGQLPELMRNLSISHQSSLEYLNLDKNLIDGSLPDDMFRFSQLKELRLGFNRLSGSIPKVYGQLPNLSVLDFTGNQIVGSISDLTSSSSLRKIYLTGNLLNGTLPASIGTLSKLEMLYLGSNHLEGVISEAHLYNLSRLQVLDLSFNSRLVIKPHPNWIPPFQLNIIRLANSYLGPDFPRWLQTQANVSELDISSAGISDSIPTWFWDQFSGLNQLNLSYNQLDGMLPDLSEKVGGLFSIDLSSNKLTGPVPKLPRRMTIVDISKNLLSGPINFWCNGFDNLGYLDVSYNLLSGELPDCWNVFTRLVFLNLANNGFHGKIPSTIGSLTSIRTLQLRNNSFSGELPESLKNLKDMDFLDLGENKLSGKLPKWMGESLSNIVVLSLRANRLNGSIPSNLWNLSKIQILDISENKLSGRIPECIKNLTAMTRDGSPTKAITHWYYFFSVSPAISSNISYKTNAFLIWKGREFEYKETLRLVKSIDLSSNNLSGEIPSGITSLVGLLGLNLSRNSLTGVIAPTIGELRLLNFLDLSRNQLRGEIPTGLSQLSHLGVLDLTSNNFSGRIPSGTQVQSFGASAYAGNPLLCGLPLPKACPGDAPSQDPKSADGSNDEKHEYIFLNPGFYISIALGYIFGFWGVCATLILNRSLRYAFFKFLDNTGNCIYALTTGRKPRSKRRQTRRLLF